MSQSSILEKQKEVYGENYLVHGDSPEGVFWNDQETQYLRFERLVSALVDRSSDQSFSIHDIGCGTCALHQYLLDSKVAHTYTGTEIVNEMLVTARNKYPDIQLLNQDITLGVESDQYDFVVLSGVLNLKKDSDPSEWKEHCSAILKAMFKMARFGIAFNFLTDRITIDPNPDLHYINPVEMFDYCHANLSRFVMIDHCYPLFEVTVSVLTVEGMRQKFPEEQFAKYLR